MGFYTAHIQDINTSEDTMRKTVTFLFYERREKIFSVKMNLFIQGNICESKKRIIKFCNKLSVSVNLPVEFSNENYYLNCKSHTYKIKTMT